MMHAHPKCLFFFALCALNEYGIRISTFKYEPKRYVNSLDAKRLRAYSDLYTENNDVIFYIHKRFILFIF